jgi:hypothetical protein
MANLFDPAQSPEIEPTLVVVGDFIQWRRTDISSDYPNTAHTLAYIARTSEGASHEITVAGTNFQADYLFTIPSATSSTFIAGYYYWQLEATQTSSGNRIVIDQGAFEIAEDLDSNTADPRTHSQIMLTKIKSLLEGKADADVSNYSVAGRSLTKLSFDELIKARDYYQEEFNKELIAERIRKKQATGATVKVRFL